MGILNKIVNYSANKEAMLRQIENKKDAISNYLPQYQKGIVGRLRKAIGLLFCKVIELYARRIVIPLKGKFVAICELRLLRQINRDLKMLSERKAAVASRVEKVVKKEGLFPELNDTNKALASDVAMATYATTAAYLAPVFLEWATSLLVRAKEQNLRLVFMARDGLGPYDMAKILQQDNPEFASVPLHYVYLSRALVEGEKEHLSQYLAQEGVLANDRKVLFVDIGFAGTMVPKIRKALTDAGVPSDPLVDKNAAEFEFFISTADKAKGYVSSPQNVLPAVESASSNRGVYWIEATHHGVQRSATALVSDENKRLVPNTVYQRATCKEKNPLDFLCIRMAGKALRDYARSAPRISTDTAKPGNVLPSGLRMAFNEKLQRVKNNRFLYVSRDNQ